MLLYLTTAFIYLFGIDSCSHYTSYIYHYTGRCFCSSFYAQANNLTNVALGKLGKLIHKQNCSSDFFFILSNLTTIRSRPRFPLVASKIWCNWINFNMNSERISGGMVSVFSSSAVDCGFEPWSDQTKVYGISICCLSDKHIARLTRNPNNVSEWSDI